MKTKTYNDVKKLSLTPKEKKELIKHGQLIIERAERIPAPKSSIMHGKGRNTVFDKVNYHWVYGNTADYIKKKKNVGRRKIDYPNNKRNSWSGANWWDCERNINTFTVDGLIFSGTKAKISFVVNDYFIDRLEELKDEKGNVVYLLPVTKYLLECV